jgi:hypothetical protein
MVGNYRRLKVRMIQNIEDLGPELHIEGFRNLPNVIVLEKRNIEVEEARSRYDVATRIAQKIETLELRRIALTGIAIGIVEGGGRRCGDCEALGLDVVIGISRINK